MNYFVPIKAFGTSQCFVLSVKDQRKIRNSSTSNRGGVSSPVLGFLPLLLPHAW